MSSFREDIAERIITLLRDNLVIRKDNSNQYMPQSNGVVFLAPKTIDYEAVLLYVFPGNLELHPAPNLPDGVAPAAYVSLDEGRHDLEGDTFVDHILENFSINIQFLLEQKIGIREHVQTLRPEAHINPLPPESYELPRSPNLQGSDLLGAINTLITQSHLQSALNHLDDVTVNEVVIEDWEFLSEFKGGPKEVLDVTITAAVTNPYDPNSDNTQGNMFLA